MLHYKWHLYKNNEIYRFLKQNTRNPDDERKKGRISKSLKNVEIGINWTEKFHANNWQ